MDVPDDTTPIARLTQQIEVGEYGAAEITLKRVETFAAADRKDAVQVLGRLAEESPETLSPLLDVIVRFLTDDEQSIRLTTAKLFVSIAQEEPDAVVSFAPDLAERLAADDEFYYVRARSAEALGYISLVAPDEAATPEILADLRVGLSFNESEVKQKLAKALAYIALGQPRRLRHHVTGLAEHLDDDDELVRYHLVTALVAVGCEHPTVLADVRTALVRRLDDENVYVRGRAAEALGLLARENNDAVSAGCRLVALQDDERFAAERAHFAVSALDEAEDSGEAGDGIGASESIQQTTDGIVEAIVAPEGECQNCGLALPESGPPLCPRCGSPH